MTIRLFAGQKINVVMSTSKSIKEKLKAGRFRPVSTARINDLLPFLFLFYIMLY